MHIADGVIEPETDNDIDLGSATKVQEFTCQRYINLGTVNMTTVDIDGGTIDGTTIGATSMLLVRLQTALSQQQT